MRKKLIIWCIGMVLGGCFITSCKVPEETETSNYNKDTVYETDVLECDCYLCGTNPDSPMAPYWGQANLGLLNLNTLVCEMFPVNHYDENQDLIAAAVRYASTVTYRGSSDAGSTFRSDTNTNRGFLSISISLNENSVLNLDHIMPHFCTNCLTLIMNDYTYADNKPHVAIVDFQNRQIKPLDRTVSYYLYGDYRINSVYKEKSHSIYLNAFYCPERFTELAFNPDETVMEQIISGCAENDIPLILDDELTAFINSLNEITSIDYAPGNHIQFNKGSKSLYIFSDGDYWILE